MKTKTFFLSCRRIPLAGFLLTIVLLLSSTTLFAQGTCLSGNCTNGKGTYQFTSGATFEGSFKDGKMVKGTFRFANGDVYTGSFSDNKFHGKGNYQYKKSGNLFVGTYVDGEKTQGKFTYKDGSTYTGSFKNHKKHGQGKLTTSTGKIFDGYWEADMYTGTTPGNKVQTYAVIVGVADYKFMEPGNGDLRFTLNDARSFNEFIQSNQGGNVPSVNIVMLLDKEASLNNILLAGRQLFTKADDNDRIIFFFSGHGSPGAFIPYDYRTRSDELTHDHVKELFAASNASVKLVFADACHSGSIKKEVSSKSVEEVLSTISIKSTLPESNRRNIAIMMSSEDDQLSYEISSLNQSVFSYYLMNGLTGSADMNHDNLITMEEIYYFVRDNTYLFVRDKVGHTQIPILFGNFDREMIIAAY
ncbi:MAG: caspase family protein [Lentimicrobium sp.]